MAHSISTIFLKAAFAVALAAVSSAPGAQGFPSKTIRIISGFAPGGGTDVVARVLAAAISPSLGQQVIVENRVGAGGTVAANVVAKSEPDGSTLLVTEHSAVVHAHLLFKDLPYDPQKDFAIVSPVFRASFVFAAGPALKANSLRELIAEARANPGKIAYGHSGNGTIHHLTMELFKQRAVIDMTAVAYKGGAQSVQDAAGGQIPLVISGQPTTEALINAGKLRALAVTSRERWVGRPDAPTVGEILPGFEVYTWASLFAPAATPREVLLRLNAEVARALRTPEIAKKLNDTGLEPPPRSLDESHQLWLAERALWPDVVRRLNLPLN